ncbi:MAG TPA: NADH:quinone oxidoreductase [Clostridiales bacterium]|jgi:Na+-transporting NADH:ubiquinone oxidoreductase subunit C|nr:NADH:quinone oxidoreductase [Clostridiales bacterium]HCS09843.1 NADH:quinone oxidoreductase [Clostridiales bacterium]
MKNSIYYPIIFMMAVTAIFITVLAGLNFVTADTISFNQESELQQKILYIFDILPDGTEKDIERVFNESVIEKEWGELRGYALIQGGKERAYAIPVKGAGLWGSIIGYIGLNTDYSEIIGIEFVTQNETPGLGGRISEDLYKEQFRGIDISGKTENFIISSPEPGSNVDAIAGATQTSNAVVKLINEDIKLFLREVEYD